MKRIWLIVIVLLGMLVLSAASPLLQTYSFQLVREKVDLYWQSDGTLDIEYEMVFANDGGADAIDYVDVGLPNNNYSIANISAEVDGARITNIEDSPYVTYGVALGLGGNAIRPGNTGTVTMRVTDIRDVLFTDNEDDAYASAVFAPNYFGSEFVHGSADITVTYHLPPGVTPAEPRWHPAPSGFPEQPVTAIDEQGRITYTWRNPNASGSSFYLFGASFPKTYVPAGTITEPSFSQRYNIDWDAIFGFLVFGCFCLFFVGIIVISVYAERRRRLKYLPPKISIAGHGIKRGLTAPEAAILLEQPMDKILTMILFSVVKKGAATVTKRDPLELDIVDPSQYTLNLREYETDFVEAFRSKGKAARRKDLQKMMVALVKSVANKMKGFSKRETVEYYRNIIKQAWEQVQADDTPDVQMSALEENLEWTMLDQDYDRRSREVFTGPVFVPRWWGRYDPGYGGSSTVTSGSGGGKAGGNVPSVGTGGAGLPSLPGGDFAASVVGGVQNMAAGVVGSLSDFTGGVTKVTNPPPKPSSSSGGGWSGGGSSCACACAGCACACAGGGR